MIQDSQYDNDPVNLWSKSSRYRGTVEEKNDLFRCELYLTRDEMGILLEQGIKRNIAIPDLIHELILKSVPVVE